MKLSPGEAAGVSETAPTTKLAQGEAAAAREASAAGEAASAPPNVISGRERIETLERAQNPLHKPDVLPEDMTRYKEAALKAREAAAQHPGDMAGACEAAQNSLGKQLGKNVALTDAKLGGTIEHAYTVTKEGMIIDPVASQRIPNSPTALGQLRAAGLRNAVNDGVFTPAQWAKFNSLKFR